MHVLREAPSRSPSDNNDEINRRKSLQGTEGPQSRGRNAQTFQPTDILAHALLLLGGEDLRRNLQLAAVLQKVQVSR